MGACSRSWVSVLTTPGKSVSRAPLLSWRGCTEPDVLRCAWKWTCSRREYTRHSQQRWTSDAPREANTYEASTWERSRTGWEYLHEPFQLLGFALYDVVFLTNTLQTEINIVQVLVLLFTTCSADGCNSHVLSDAALSCLDSTRYRYGIHAKHCLGHIIFRDATRIVYPHCSRAICPREILVRRYRVARMTRMDHCVNATLARSERAS